MQREVRCKPSIHEKIEMVKQKQRTHITQSRINCAMNCAFHGLHLIGYQYKNATFMSSLSQQLSEKLQKLQNRAARVITKSSYNTNSNYLLNSLGWDNLSVRRTKQKANLMYKCVNKLAPNYLCNMFTPRTMSFHLRDASQKLYLPKPRTDYLKRSFSYSGASLWNDLPEDIHNTKSLRNFKRRIDKWLSVSDSHTANM